MKVKLYRILKKLILDALFFKDEANSVGDIMFDDLIIFDFLNKFHLEDVQILFVSSEKGYAVNVFESNAVDFILKPF